MRLKELVKIMDTSLDVNIYVKEENIWSGNMILLTAAAGKNRDKEDFIEYLIEDKEFESIGKIVAAEKLLDMYLDESDDEPTYFEGKLNENGFYVTTINIYLQNQ